MHALVAAAPALPLDEAGKYVAAAYIAFLLLVVVYVAIMAAKVQRIERELRDLASFAEQKKGPTAPPTLGRGAAGAHTREDASRSDSSRPTEVAAVRAQGESDPPATDAERSKRAESL